MNSLLQNTVVESDYRVKGYDPKNALPHIDNSVEFIQFWSDGGYFMVNNHVIPIKPGTILLIDAVNMHYSNPSVLESYTRNKLIIPTDCFNQICSLCGLEDLQNKLRANGFFAYYSNSPSTNAQSADKLFKEIFQCVADHKKTSFAKAKIIEYIIQILLLLSTNTLNENVDGSTFDIMQQLTNYVNTQLDTWEDISLDSICTTLHISRSYASYLFKKLTNKSLTQYAMDLRLSEAKKLLLTTDSKICNIAEMLNFKDSTTFCKTFKKHFGLTPRAYRLSHGNPLV